MREHILQIHTLRLCEVADVVIEEVRLGTGVAVRSDFFLIGENRDRRVLRILGHKLRHECRIRADSVVLAVAADQRAVKADVARLCSRHKLDFRSREIALGNAVLLIQIAEHFQAERLFHIIVRIGRRAEHNVELLAAKALGERSLHLLLREVNQEVGDVKHRIARILTDRDFDRGAVLLHDNAVHCERHAAPLVLLDAAVVVGLKECNVIRLIERIRS